MPQRQIVTLRITSDPEQGKLCRGFRLFVHNRDWEQDCGKPVQVYLPPLPPSANCPWDCGELKYEMVNAEGYEGAKDVRPGPTYICRHFLDMD